jgi:hypothetical protein
MQTTTATTRPTWNQLTHREKLAAFAMNQDNFEQSGQSKADEWESFKDCFNDEEWAATWTELCKQANAFDMASPDWKSLMSEFLKAAR